MIEPGNDDATGSTAHGGTPAIPEEPIANPGLPAHTWRPTDLDEGAAKRAERQVAGFFFLSMVCTVLFIVAYFTLQIGDNFDTFIGLGASTVALGLALGGAMLFIGVGIIQWARKLMGDHEISELRHSASSSVEDREATLAALDIGIEESGIGRRPLVRNSLLGAVGMVGLPLVVILRDLGPTNNQVANAEAGTGLQHTIWKKGMRLVRDVVGTPIMASELEIGDLVNAAPEALFPTEENGYPEIEGVKLNVQKAKGAIIIVKMEPDEIKHGKGRENWTVDGVICYSKICTHVGCPISLYERTTHHVLCPCHQSTFDLADSAKVIFGPAHRPLPQLPLAVDDEGYLIAQADFDEPVGASYWEREKQ
ncbi:ubiquinol-cytochrome c reductase iron-sulfur subunit [Nocardioides currus]|uniref:Cytochrome bc1 complex Rieske iron-sulfur subunit n=1 Tax=Nocardioides currus TaxID=2133958 RepID=A0A2R7YXL8_9ACTN|nr:Rieske 2Fe-2S domain-containing protein [Nocardioides currus]PUA80629.1 ubiquinol-cytochrome C reductase [Nocardioides currus]